MPAVGEELVDIREYVRNNAGKAFEFMLEKVEADRASAGLPDIATVRAEASEHPEVDTRESCALVRPSSPCFLRLLPVLESSAWIYHFLHAFGLWFSMFDARTWFMLKLCASDGSQKA